MSTPDRLRTLDRERFDVVIVGAGTGGLTAAALLARHGRSVLVVERHYVVGGNSTVFRRPGYAFDVGLHYIGSCEPHDAIPRILAASGVDDLRFLRLGAGGRGDVFVLPGMTLEVPNSLEGFLDVLEQRFPDERRGIRRFGRLLAQLDRLSEGLKRPASLPLVLARVPLVLRYRFATLKKVLDRCVSDPQLRALLAGWQVVYALPPSRASALVHAGAAMHYLPGSYYPAGGGQRMSNRLAEEVERHGGKILLRAEARRVVIDGRRARGVEIDSPHLGRRTIRAGAVILNADIQHSLLELVGAENLSTRERQRTEGYSWPAAIALLCLGVKRDLAAEGITSATYAIYPELDVEPCYAAAARGERYPRPFVCFSVPTLKDPDNPRLAPPGVHNVQLMSVAPSAPEAWGVTEEALRDGRYRRDPEYLRRKRAFSQLMLAQVERLLLPGLSEQVVFSELATPLTHRRYTHSSTGSGYGIALTPDQIFLKRPPARTSVAGLYLAGASLRTMHGIVGALHSGLSAADEIVGGGLRTAVLAGHAA